MSFRTSQIAPWPSRLLVPIAAFLLICVPPLVFAARSGAEQPKKKIVTMTWTIDARKDATTGAVTIEATTTSPDPKCLSVVRHEGTYIHVASSLYYGAPIEDTYIFFRGFDGSAPLPGADKGEDVLHLISPPGQSPLVWQKVLTGDLATSVHNRQSGPHNEALPKDYESTVGAAAGITTNSRGLYLVPEIGPPYRRGKQLLQLVCRTRPIKNMPYIPFD